MHAQSVLFQPELSRPGHEGSSQQQQATDCCSASMEAAKASDLAVVLFSSSQGPGCGMLKLGRCMCTFMVAASDEVGHPPKHIALLTRRREPGPLPTGRAINVYRLSTLLVRRVDGPAWTGGRAVHRHNHEE